MYINIVDFSSAYCGTNQWLSQAWHSRSARLSYGQQLLWLVQDVALATAASRATKLRARQRLGEENERCEKQKPPTPPLIGPQW